MQRLLTLSMTSTIKMTNLETTIKPITQSCIKSSEHHDHQSSQKDKKCFFGTLCRRAAAKAQKYGNNNDNNIIDHFLLKLPLLRIYKRHSDT